MEEENWLKIGSQALKKAALNEEAKTYLLSHPKLFNLLKKAANRYIGGEQLEEAIASIKKLNEAGFVVTTDFMGESIRSEKDANEATEEFFRFSKSVKKYKVNSSISLDLSHIGLLVSEDLVKRNLEAICKEASKNEQEVIISMEGIDRTDAIIEIYKNTIKRFTNLGITLQAYLYRTKDDFQEIVELPGSIRIVKGAYEVPKNIAMERGDKLDEVYLGYVEELLSKNKRCSIASHHEKIHREASKLVDQYSPKNYVFERLLGIRNEELKAYRSKGYNCRIYVVYGKEWYLYLCNRWAEYPLNLFRGLADIVE
ncbi:MAG: proline dehydrogenase family protein [Bacteroidota bacterium]